MIKNLWFDDQNQGSKDGPKLPESQIKQEIIERRGSDVQLIKYLISLSDKRTQEKSNNKLGALTHSHRSTKKITSRFRCLRKLSSAKISKSEARSRLLTIYEDNSE